MEYEHTGGLVLAADQLKALGVGGDAGVSHRLWVCSHTKEAVKGVSGKLRMK